MGGLVAMSRSSPGLASKSEESFDVGSVVKTTPDEWFREFGGSNSAAGVAVTQSTAVRISTVYACTSIRSKDVARCTPRLMRKDSARSEKPVINHPVAKLFVRPNKWQTWTEWCRQMHAAYLLRGNAYAVILRDIRGQPIALIPINPDLVSLYEAPGGFIFYSVARSGVFLSAVLQSLPFMISEDDVFHLRDVGFNMLLGLSRISIAKDSFGVAIGLEQQAARFMANGARPSGVLQTDKLLSDTAATRLRTQWEQLRSGLQNVGRTAILEEGLKWNPMQLSSVDLEFIAQRDHSVSDIARWFDMPLYKLNVPGEMARIKFDDADQAYVNTTIMPDLDVWEEKVAQKFDLDKDGLDADFDERRLLRAAEATRINNQRLKIMSGISTQNECRAENGDPPLPGGDVLLRPVNLAASGSDMTGTAADGAGRPAGGDLPDPGAANDESKSLLLIQCKCGAVLNPGEACQLCTSGRKFNPDQPRDDHGRFGEGGSGSSPDGESSHPPGSGLAETAKWLKTASVGEVLSTVATSHKTKEAISFALQSLVSHTTGLDQSTWKLNEDIIEHSVNHIADIAAITTLQAKELLQTTMSRLVSLRKSVTGKAEPGDDDEVLAALEFFARELEKFEPKSSEPDAGDK